MIDLLDSETKYVYLYIYMYMSNQSLKETLKRNKNQQSSN